MTAHPPASAAGTAAGSGASTIVYSIVILTYARDEVLRQVLDTVRQRLGQQRRDFEVVLVDNNVDEVDRSQWLLGFPAHQYLKSGFNKGVIARNDGMSAAIGEILVVIDDDVLVQTDDFLDPIGRAFAGDARLGVVVARKLDHRTMETRRDAIPHTRKHLDVTQPFTATRFVGGCLCFRAEVHRTLGGFSAEFFYGLEEIEYSYRVIEAGWKILYLPDVVAVELEHPGGRRPLRQVQTEMLTNKFIISYLHMPFPHYLVNFLLYPAYLMIFYRQQASLPQAVAGFLRWWRRPDRTRRRPIGRAARAYIRENGGHLWR